LSQTALLLVTLVVLHGTMTCGLAALLLRLESWVACCTFVVLLGLASGLAFAAYFAAPALARGFSAIALVVLALGARPLLRRDAMACWRRNGSWRAGMGRCWRIGFQAIGRRCKRVPTC
jgi:hypothetical protein